MGWLYCGEELEFSTTLDFTTMLFNNTNYALLQSDLMRTYLEGFSVWSPT